MKPKSWDMFAWGYGFFFVRSDLIEVIQAPYDGSMMRRRYWKKVRT